ncbi:MAG: NAD(P)-dependent oxidoreductase [Bacteroidota bacterium]
MNILITGATGLLGIQLANQLAEQHTIYAIDRDKSRAPMLQHPGIQLLDIDLFNLNPDILPKNIDTVFYLAQSKQFRDFPGGAMDMFAINVKAPLSIIHWAVEQKVKNFFYTSTGGVYKNPTEPVKEFFDINANEKNGFYIGSKLSAEILLKNYSHFFEKFAILRPFFIYGPHQDASMLIPRLIQRVQKGETIFLDREEGLRVNPIFVTDAAMAFSKLLQIEGEHLFNIAGKETLSLMSLCKIIGKTLGKTPIFSINEQIASDLIADTSLMHQLLHFPQTDLQEGIRLTAKAMGLVG